MTSLKRHFLKNFPTKFDKIFRHRVKLMSDQVLKVWWRHLTQFSSYREYSRGGRICPPPAGRGLNLGIYCIFNIGSCIVYFLWDLLVLSFLINAEIPRKKTYYKYPSSNFSEGLLLSPRSGRGSVLHEADYRLFFSYRYYMAWIRKYSNPWRWLAWAEALDFVAFSVGIFEHTLF